MRTTDSDQALNSDHVDKSRISVKHHACKSNFIFYGDEEKQQEVILLAKKVGSEGVKATSKPNNTSRNEILLSEQCLQIAQRVTLLNLMQYVGTSDHNQLNKSS